MGKQNRTELKNRIENAVIKYINKQNGDIKSIKQERNYGKTVSKASGKSRDVK